MNRKRSFTSLFLGWILLCCFLTVSQAKQLELVDDAGKTLRFAGVPQRVVSLVPSATEIIFALGAGDNVFGITHHSSGLPGAADKAIVGGFVSPSLDEIDALQPDLIVAATRHIGLLPRLSSQCPVVIMDTRHMEDAFRHIRLMGDLFNRQQAAEKLIAGNRQQLLLIASKIAKIPPEKRKRVMRLMGRDEIMTPGSDSFQNEMIRAAGGLTQDFGRKGQVVPVSKEQFVGFDPEFLYGCTHDQQSIKPLLLREGYRSVSAVRTDDIHFLPCELTCRASAHLGYFVSWLSALIYRDEFSNPANEVLTRSRVATKPLAIDLDFVKDATVVTSIVHDFANKSLIVDFNKPRTVVSTLDGQRDNIVSVGNHYTPPPCWGLNSMGSLKELKNEILPVIGKKVSSSVFLFTGADMDNLAMKKKTYKEMTVYALVTAGVRGNAVRMSKDVGNYYEPGTINILILTNRRLTPRAMTRAIISATEGKTAALQDLDIRSSYQPLTSSATGTGTDNIIVVQGDGKSVDNAGGHCKMGELIARATYAGVKEAIAKQNGITQNRDIFQRLVDRHLSVSLLVDQARGIDKDKRKKYIARIEQVLLDPVYSGFLASALAISDGAERREIESFALYEGWCRAVAAHIAKMEVKELGAYLDSGLLPEPLAMAMNAIFTGVAAGGLLTPGNQP